MVSRFREEDDGFRRGVFFVAAALALFILYHAVRRLRREPAPMPVEEERTPRASSEVPGALPSVKLSGPPRARARRKAPPAFSRPETTPDRR